MNDYDCDFRLPPYLQVMAESGDAVARTAQATREKDEEEVRRLRRANLKATNIDNANEGVITLTATSEHCLRRSQNRRRLSILRSSDIQHS